VKRFLQKLQWQWQWTNAKRWQRFATCGLANANNCETPLVHQRVLFFQKKSWQRYKRLEDCGGRPKPKETDHPGWKTYHCCYCKVYTEGEWVTTNAYQVPPFQDMWPWISFTYRFWLKLGFTAGQCACAHHHFPCRKNAVHWKKYDFAAIFTAPKLAGLWQQRRMQAKGNAVAHPKIGSLKRTVWQLRAGAAKLPLAQAALGEGHRHWQWL
jgi:hypothetical protein